MNTTTVEQLNTINLSLDAFKPKRAKCSTHFYKALIAANLGSTMHSHTL